MNKQKGVDKVYLTKYDVYRTNKKEAKQVNILAEVTIDETGIIKQMDAVKEAADKFEDEDILKMIAYLYGVQQSKE